MTIEGKPDQHVVARRLADAEILHEKRLVAMYPAISAVGTYLGARAFRSNEGVLVTIDTATLESRAHEYAEGSGAAIGAFGEVIVCARFVGLDSPSEIAALRR